MYLKYHYLFSSSKGLPPFVYKCQHDEPDGRALLRIDPISESQDFGEVSRRFWDYLTQVTSDHLPSWSARVSYGAHDTRYGRKARSVARLFALDTSFLLGREVIGERSPGCPLCGVGKLLNESPKVDERTVISWEFAFTDTGRFVAHIDIYEQLLEMKFSGFESKPVSCLHPDEAVIRAWTGHIQKNRELLAQYGAGLPACLRVEEWGDATLIFIPSHVLETKEFRLFHAYLKHLDEIEELPNDFIPAARQVGNLPRCRWVELIVTGNAGREIPYNEYDPRVRCPSCGKGGLLPIGQMGLNYSEWDGSDFCKTETGRICLSKKAYQWTSTFHPLKWKYPAEPIRDYDASHPAPNK